MRRNNCCVPKQVQPNWQYVNCDALNFTSEDDSVSINKTANCTFDFSVEAVPNPLITADTNSVDLSGDGSLTFLTANVNISEQEGNIITINSDGLYAESVTELTANNGLSISGSNVVLGQDLGEGGNPAGLLSNREIPMGTNLLAFTGFTITPGVYSTIDRKSFIVHSDTGASNTGEIIIEDATLSSQIAMRVEAAGPNISSGYTDTTLLFHSAGNLSFGSSSHVDTGQKLQIEGSVLTPNVIGSTTSSGTLTLSSTSHATKGNILFGNSAYNEANNRLGLGTTTPSSNFEIFGSGASVITSRMTATMGTTQLILDGQSNVFTMQGSFATVNLLSNNLTINIPSSGGIIQAPSSMAVIGSYNWIRLLHSHHNQVTGDGVGVLSNQTFAPTSGTATFTTLALVDSINQTGGANGIVRGIYINPGITAVADYRAIQIDNNIGFGIYQAGASASNLFAGTFRLTGIPTYADDAAAGAGGLITGFIYKTATGELRIKL